MGVGVFIVNERFPSKKMTYEYVSEEFEWLK